MLLRHLFASVLLLSTPVLLAAPVLGQTPWPREFPTEQGVLDTVAAVRAGGQDGFAALRGERVDAERWHARAMDGLTAGTGERLGRARLEALTLLEQTVLSYDLHAVDGPDDATAASMEQDFRTLRGWLLDAAGDWDFSSSTDAAGTRRFVLERPDGEVRLQALLFREDLGGRRGWWTLRLVATAPWVAPPPWEGGGSAAVPAPAGPSFLPTRAGFTAVVEAMKEGAYRGGEPLKGLVAPRANWDRNGGMTTWGVMPMAGLEPDLEAATHCLFDLGDRGMVRYRIAQVSGPTEAQRAALEAGFRTLQDWMATCAAGWVVELDFEPWSMLSADSRRFALVPEPRRPVQRVDGNAVPRLELWLRKRPPRSRDGEEVWSLVLEGELQGAPRRGHGMGDWVVAHLERTDPAQELPALPDDLEQEVLALLADASQGFAAFAAPGEPLVRPGPGFEWRAEDFPFLPWSPRRAVTTRLMEEADPRGTRDFLVVEEGERRSDAQVRLGLLLVRDANALTRHRIDGRFDEVVTRLAAALDGWRHRVSDVPGGKEDFQVRLATFDWVRPDGRPLWILLERMTWLARPAGQPEQEITSLALYVGTDQRGRVGYDLAAVWREELESEGSPLAAVVGVLGDPLAELLQPGDLVAPVGGAPVDLSAVVGANGEAELRLELVRDGRFLERAVALPRIPLARWQELQEACAAGELPPEALSVLGARIEDAGLSALVRELLAAGEGDFAALPAAFVERLEHRNDRELHTVALPLWRAEVAPSLGMIDALRAGLADALGPEWLVEPYSRSSGPFWDWFSRQTHWSARHEGPEGMRPWVELAEETTADGVVLELQVHAFSVAHREAHAAHPQRLWFQPISGDCVDGRGLAWSYRDGVTFAGPYRDGVAHGRGEHVFADDTAFVDVLYEGGRLRFTGKLKPPPLAVSPVRRDHVLDFSSAAKYSDWKNEWGELITFEEVPPAPTVEFVDIPGGPSRTCVACNGMGDQWNTVEYEVYQDTMAFAGTTAYDMGYDTIRHHYGTRRDSYLGACSSCGGTGRQAY